MGINSKGTDDLTKSVKEELDDMGGLVRPPPTKESRKGKEKSIVSTEENFYTEQLNSSQPSSSKQSLEQKVEFHSQSVKSSQALYLESQKKSRDMGTGGNNGCKRKHDDSPMLVSPGESGVGLPYAPIDWPNPGDLWSWRVGWRYSSKGIFRDRFLYAPERLQDNASRKLIFASKNSLVSHIKSAFPKADIDSFFESFTWEIPVKNDSNCEDPRGKGKSVPSPEVLTTAPVKSMANGGRSTKRSQKAALKKKDKVSTGDGNIDLSINIFSGEEERRRCSSYDNGGSPEKNFESFLNSMDELLCLSVPPTVDVRKELSSLIAEGFTSLISSDDKVSELTALTFKLQNDSSLSTSELDMLNLIREIPFSRKRLLEAKEVSLQANKFFANLETKLAAASFLKKEFATSKNEIKVAKASEESTRLEIVLIDQQPTHLQSKKQALTETAEAINKKIKDLESIQIRVKDRLPKIVEEVQIANSEKCGWERLRDKAAEVETEILLKFAPLKGFSF